MKAHNPDNKKLVVQGGTGIYGRHVKLPHIGHADPDGKETVTVHTDPNCPCAMLDAQSGELKSGAITRPRSHTSETGWGQGTIQLGGPYEASSGGASRFFYTAKASRKERRGSRHPTVKPLALMKWLVTLVTPPGGLVLDPFCGSGSTLEAAYALGFRAIGIDNDKETMRDCQERLRQLVLL